MSETGIWWKLANAVPAPSRRLFGIFRRDVQLHGGAPSRVTIPSPKAADPRCFRIEAEERESMLGSLGAELTASRAVNLFTRPSQSIDGWGGSVALAGVLLVAEPIPSAGRTQEARAAPSTPRTLETAVEQEIPLSKRLAYLLQPPTDLLLSEAGPIQWPAALFDYQLEGVEALLSRHALLLADDMGLGKTIQAAAALRILFLQRRAESALVIVPASLVTQWRTELRRWAPELRISTVHGPPEERAWQWGTQAHVFLTTYSTFSSDFTDNPQSPPRRRVWDVVVLDEGQKIKNRDTQVSRKCKLVPRRRAWVLTGTPLENRPDDLASILEFAVPRGLGEAPLRVFEGPELRERHKTMQLRRKKTEVLPQLPPKLVTKISFPLSAEQREVYQRVESQGVTELERRGEAVRVENVLELILRLKQICNFCPTTGRSAKLEDIRERLETLRSEGYRALVFSQFTDNQYGAQAIAAGLASANPLLYTGEMSLGQRESIIRQFKQDPSRQVLVLSLRAGGQGLNLQEASYVFHFDRWWNPAVEHQAEDRSHRLGQAFPVNVYKYTCEGTIEEKIEAVLEEKQLLFDELVDDVSIDVGSKLTSEELFGLFGLEPPETAKRPSRAVGRPVDYGAMTGVEFEQHVQRVLEKRGWQVETTPLSRDAGIDLIARREDDIGIEMTLYLQCKNHASPVGVSVVRELNGAMPRQRASVRGVVVCPSGFTADATAFARDRGIALWDRHHLFELTHV